MQGLKEAPLLYIQSSQQSHRPKSSKGPKEPVSPELPHPSTLTIDELNAEIESHDKELASIQQQLSNIPPDSLRAVKPLLQCRVCIKNRKRGCQNHLSLNAMPIDDIKGKIAEINTKIAKLTRQSKKAKDTKVHLHTLHPATIAEQCERLKADKQIWQKHLEGVEWARLSTEEKQQKKDKEERIQNEFLEKQQRLIKEAGERQQKWLDWEQERDRKWEEQRKEHERRLEEERRERELAQQRLDESLRKLEELLFWRPLP